MCIQFVLLFGTIVALQVDITSAGCYGSSLTDICDNSSSIPSIPDLTSRDPSIMINDTSDTEYCDLGVIKKQQWYKSENGMTTSCPLLFSCGTISPIWMKDSNPEPHEGIVNRTSCLKGSYNCCLISYRLAAVNCGSYLAYCLIDLPSGCNQRYCFDIPKLTKDIVTSTKAVTDTARKKTTAVKTPVSQHGLDTTQMPKISSSAPVLTDSSTFYRDIRKERNVHDDKEYTVILVASLTLSAGAVAGLVLAVVYFKRNIKVNKETTHISAKPVVVHQLDVLHLRGLGVPNQDKNDDYVVSDMSKRMHYESLKFTNDIVDDLEKIRPDTVSPCEHDYDMIQGDQNEG